MTEKQTTATVTTLIALGQATESLRHAVAGIHAAMSRTPLGPDMVEAMKRASNLVYQLKGDHEEIIRKLQETAAERDENEGARTTGSNPLGRES